MLSSLYKSVFLVGLALLTSCSTSTTYSEETNAAEEQRALQTINSITSEFVALTEKYGTQQDYVSFDAYLKTRNTRIARFRDLLARIKTVDTESLSNSNLLTYYTLEFYLSLQEPNLLCGYGDWRVAPYDDWLHTLESRAFDLLAGAAKKPVSAQRVDSLVSVLENGVEKAIMLRSGYAGLGVTESRPVIELYKKESNKRYAGDSPSSNIFKLIDDKQVVLDDSQRKAYKTRVIAALDKYNAFIDRALLSKARTKPGLGSLPSDYRAACSKALLSSALTDFYAPDSISRILDDFKKRYGERFSTMRRKYDSSSSDSEFLQKVLFLERFNIDDDHELNLLVRQYVDAAESLTQKYFYRQPILYPEIIAEPRNAVNFRATARYEPATEGQEAAVVLNLKKIRAPKMYLFRAMLHEGVPGHHLMFALNAQTPQFSYGLPQAARIEAWAVYSEMVLDHYSVFKDDNELGFLTWRLLPAIAAIAENHIHSVGYDTELLVQFMVNNGVTDAGAKNAAYRLLTAIPFSNYGYSITPSIYYSQFMRLIAAGYTADQIRDFHETLLKNSLPPVYAVRHLVNRLIGHRGHQDNQVFTHTNHSKSLTLQK
jgi:uncharacterized protein (DUF885 family)